MREERVEEVGCMIMRLGVEDQTMYLSKESIGL